MRKFINIITESDYSSHDVDFTEELGENLNLQEDVDDYATKWGEIKIEYDNFDWSDAEPDVGFTGELEDYDFCGYIDDATYSKEEKFLDAVYEKIKDDILDTREEFDTICKNLLKKHIYTIVDRS